MSGHYLEVDKINVKYGDIQVLWDASFYADKRRDRSSCGKQRSRKEHDGKSK